MPRYEEMDDLLQRVRKTLGAEPRPETAPNPLPAGGVHVVNVPFVDARESLTCILGDALRLQASLTEDATGSLARSEHDELMTLLGKVLHELWLCESALRRSVAAE